MPDYPFFARYELDRLEEFSEAVENGEIDVKESEKQDRKDAIDALAFAAVINSAYGYNKSKGGDIDV